MEGTRAQTIYVLGNDGDEPIGYFESYRLAYKAAEEFFKELEEDDEEYLDRCELDKADPFKDYFEHFMWVNAVNLIVAT